MPRLKVLGSIDNVLLYASAPGVQAAHALKSDFVSRSTPKAWAWDAKWSSDVDLEEDEMHRQLWQRQPADAHRFKRLCAGKYIFEGRKVELKILYSQLLLTNVEDGQVLPIEDFLLQNFDSSPPATAITEDIYCHSPAGTYKAVPSLASAAALIAASNVKSAPSLGSAAMSVASTGCSMELPVAGVASVVSSAPSVTDTSPPPSPPKVSLASEARSAAVRPSTHPGRATEKQATSATTRRSIPVATSLYATRSPKSRVRDIHPFSTRHHTIGSSSEPLVPWRLTSTAAN